MTNVIHIIPTSEVVRIGQFVKAAPLLQLRERVSFTNPTTAEAQDFRISSEFLIQVQIDITLRDNENEVTEHFQNEEPFVIYQQAPVLYNEHSAFLKQKDNEELIKSLKKIVHNMARLEERRSNIMPGAQVASSALGIVPPTPLVATTSESDLLNRLEIANKHVTKIINNGKPNNGYPLVKWAKKTEIAKFLQSITHPSEFKLICTAIDKLVATEMNATFYFE